METSDHENILLKIAEVEKQLASLKQQQDEAEATLQSLRERLVKLDDQAAIRSNSSSALSIATATTPTPSEKVALFIRLFRGRDDVFPKLWQNQKTGKKGYSPACANEWVRGVCEKPRVKCGECPNQAFLPVTADTVLDHLQGRHVIGVYPMLKDETCWFLAADFDKEAWREDVSGFYGNLSAYRRSLCHRAFSLWQRCTRLVLLQQPGFRHDCKEDGQLSDYGNHGAATPA